MHLSAHASFAGELTNWSNLLQGSIGSLLGAAIGAIVAALVARYTVLRTLEGDRRLAQERQVRATATQLRKPLAELEALLRSARWRTVDPHDRRRVRSQTSAEFDRLVEAARSVWIDDVAFVPIEISDDFRRLLEVFGDYQKAFADGHEDSEALGLVVGQFIRGLDNVRLNPLYKHFTYVSTSRP